MALRVMAPRMPPLIESTLQEDWSDLDADIEPIFEFMKDARVFHQFAHGRDTFMSHLRGTWQMLACWNQPEAICRCGLFHSAYTRDGFFFRYFDMHDPKSRGLLSSKVGAEAEQLVWNYCVAESLWDMGEFLGQPEPVPGGGVRLGEPLDPAGQDFPSRSDPSKTIHFSPEEIAAHFVTFVADLAEQMCDVISYISVYQHDVSERLWPGTGQPGFGLSFFSRMLITAAPYLKVVPPIFNNCTATLSTQDEAAARDAYWGAVQGEGEAMPRNQQEELLLQAHRLNPWIAEPQILLSQLLFDRGAFAEAAHHAACALQTLYDWGTCWDKRSSYPQWVGFGRMAHLRASRRCAGLSKLPSVPLSARAHPEATEVTYLQDVLAGFEEVTEKEPAAAAARLAKASADAPVATSRSRL